MKTRNDGRPFPLQWVLLAILVLFAYPGLSAAAANPKLRLISHDVSEKPSPLHAVFYSEPNGLRLVTRSRFSDDNGQTWAALAGTPDFSAGMPYGYRRNPATSVVDSKTKRLVTIVNALDTPGLDPAKVEPAIALSQYYLRYRVSEDGGRTWLFDEPIVQDGDFTEKHPFEDIEIGKNGFFLGDAGSIPIVNSGGEILVPAQATMMDSNGKLYNPTGQTTFTDVFVIIGTWQDDGHLHWTASPRVQGDQARTTRGVIEPTLAEFKDGRILMVMRGSNAGQPNLPGHRWFSVSENSGHTWSSPEPWTYDDNQPFFSPSSMSTNSGFSTFDEPTKSATKRELGRR